MREIVSVTRLLLVAMRCTRLMRLVRWDLRRDWWWAGLGEWGWLWWGLWGQRGWWVTMSWMKIVKSVKLMSDDWCLINWIRLVRWILHSAQYWSMEINNWIWQQSQACSTLHPHPMLPNWKQYLPYYFVS